MHTNAHELERGAGKEGGREGQSVVARNRGDGLKRASLRFSPSGRTLPRAEESALPIGAPVVNPLGSAAVWDRLPATRRRYRRADNGRWQGRAQGNTRRRPGPDVPGDR